MYSVEARAKRIKAGPNFLGSSSIDHVCPAPNASNVMNEETVTSMFMLSVKSDTGRIGSMRIARWLPAGCPLWSSELIHIIAVRSLLEKIMLLQN